MKNISLKLSNSEIGKLEHVAEAEGLSKSEVIRKALEFYFDSRSEVTRGSALDALSEFVGCFEGPGDLSYNPKYMEGFGE